MLHAERNGHGTRSPYCHLPSCRDCQPGASGLGLSLSAGAYGVAAQNATPGVEVGGVTILPPDHPYAGATLGEWHARSWQWAMSVPTAVNPSFAADGSGCEIGQFGPVFFVPGQLYGGAGHDPVNR
jgi:hypothetical protein